MIYFEINAGKSSLALLQLLFIALGCSVLSQALLPAL